MRSMTAQWRQGRWPSASILARLVVLGTVLSRVTGAQVAPVPQEPGLPAWSKDLVLSTVSWMDVANRLKAKQTDDQRVQAFEAAADFTRDFPEPLFEAWRLRQAFPEKARRLRETGDEAQVALEQALLAWDLGRLDSVLLGITDTAKRAVARRHARFAANTLTSVLNELGEAPTVQLFAEGDIRGVATGDSTKGATGTGSLGLTLRNRFGMWQASLAVASTTDTVTKGFGNTVLSPSTGRGLGSGLVSYFWDAPVSPYLPQVVHVYGSLSTFKWSGEYLNGGAPETVTTDAAVLALGVLGRSVPACCRVGDNPVTLALEYGIAARWLNGNAIAHKEWRRQTLNTDQTVFVGPEVGLQIAFGKVTGSLAAYYLVSNYNPHVDGLTKLQVLAAFTASSEVFRGSLAP